MANATKCLTKNAEYHISISDDEIDINVKVPFCMKLTEKKAQLLETLLHNQLELVLHSQLEEFRSGQLYRIGRFAEGISLNGKEYLLTGPENGSEIMTFATYDEAFDFLIKSGADSDEIGHSIFIEEVE